MANPLVINAVAANGGFYCTTQKEYSSYPSPSPLRSLLIDGQHPKETFRHDWVFIRTEPTRIEKIIDPHKINHRFELIDNSFKSDKVKEVFQCEEVATKIEGVWEWRTEFAHLRSLYQLRSDLSEQELQEVPFQFNIVLEAERIITPGTFSFQAAGSGFAPTTRTISREAIQHQLLDKIIFPEIVIPSTRSRLSSRDSYDIIRQYVKDNIDSKHARITSDYEFCFAVGKRLKLSVPEKYNVNLNAGRPRAKPKYVEQSREDKIVNILSITHDESNYKGHTPVPGFVGENEPDLKNKIDEFLHDLIAFINRPIEECRECGGTGHILPKPYVLPCV